MIGLLFTLCLFGTVKSSDIVDLQVQTVRRGDNTTIKCHQKAAKHDLLTWYQQSLGKLPQYIVRRFETEENSPKKKVKHRFSKKFENSSFTVDTETFDFSINGVKEEDVGIYFCGKGRSNSLEFLSGTLLLFAAEKTDYHPPPDPAIKNEEAVKLQCSVEAVTLSCSGDRSVYWIRHGSGESHHDHEAKSAGKDFSDKKAWIVFLVTSNVISVILIAVLSGILCKKHQEGSVNGHQDNSNHEVEETDVLNYATVNFAQKPPSRAPRVEESQDIYSQVQVR
ncbi:uncharacterized protein LOC108415408 [Pygocentrus nattereri]|uniref:uncharacterized protein LOC108415408 n=1 Tax=Pygocentrus nattereri TaxID=42514 RepID=UPI0018919AAA|nr:uncharacterized protein LOC108415408 [Pygocentrus nattereri]